MNSSYAQSLDNFKTYTSSDLKFSIDHPSNWKAEESVTDKNVTGVDFTIRENKEDQEKDDSFFPAFFYDSFFSVRVEDPETELDTYSMTLKNTSLPERVQDELDTISPMNDKTLIRQNEVTVGGNHGWKIEYRSTDEHKDRYVSVIFISANGKFYILRYVDDPLKVPETLPLINRMVESFQVRSESMDSSNGLTSEEYRKKYCPEYANETQLLVLCSPSELEESDDVPAPPED